MRDSLDDATRSLVQVETDKPVYAPGQKIKIRTLVADIENTALIKQKDGATLASVEVKDALERTIFKKADCAVGCFWRGNGRGGDRERATAVRVVDGESGSRNRRRRVESCRRDWI